MTQPITLVIVGMGGYGEVYLEALLEKAMPDVDFRIAGAVDPVPERCRYLDTLRSMQVPLFPSLEAFYRHGQADLAVISSPIQYHCAQTCLALSQQSHVLCEKPAAATVQEVDRMIRARDEAQKQVSIGYQWSFSSTINALKEAILDNRFGVPHRMKSLCLWPRDASYYARNRWAGCKKDEGGAWVLDSPVNNAMAHYLHNMLFLLGPSMDLSATPLSIEAELFRANPIENYDTAALRIKTRNHVEIDFYGAHPVEHTKGPTFSFEFEDAVISSADQGEEVIVRFHDGTIETYAHPDNDDQCTKLWACMKATREDKPFPCSLEAARAQTVCMNGAQTSMPDAMQFPPSLIRCTGASESALTWVQDLAQLLETSWEEGKLLSEKGISWAKPGQVIELENFDQYPVNPT